MLFTWCLHFFDIIHAMKLLKSFKKYFFIGIFLSLFLSLLEARTLKDSLSEMLIKDPTVEIGLRAFKAKKPIIKTEELHYYPQLNLKLDEQLSKSIKIKKDSLLSKKVDDDVYIVYEYSLLSIQKGFNKKKNKNIKSKEIKTLLNSYNYVEKSNEISFDVTRAYLDLLSTYELVEVAKEHVKVKENLYVKIKKLFNSNLATDLDMKKIELALSLSRSSLGVEKNNLKEMQYIFKRVLGYTPDLQTLKKPDFDTLMPKNIQSAAQYAIKNNPSIIANRYNKVDDKIYFKKLMQDYYKTGDIGISSINDDVQKKDIFDFADDRFRDRLILNYADFYATQDEQQLKQRVIQDLQIPWQAYEMVTNQIQDLYDYNYYSKETLSQYKKDFDKADGSLDDLLASYNDLFNSKNQIIITQYEQFYTKYRILDAIGLLVTAIAEDIKMLDYAPYMFKQNFNLHVKFEENSFNLPKSSADKVKKFAKYLEENPKYNLLILGHTDSEGRANSNMKLSQKRADCIKIILQNYGIKSHRMKSEGRGELEPIASNDTMRGKVLNRRIEIKLSELEHESHVVAKTDHRSKPIEKLESVPRKSEVAAKTIAISYGQNFTLKAKFAENSSVVPVTASKEIQKFVKYLNMKKRYKVLIIGHTDNKGNEEANLKLSQSRADAIKEALILEGVDSSRLISEGRGELEPIATNATLEGMNLNRRVEIELHQKTDTQKKAYYIQVGSFSKKQPRKQFLNSITKLGYNYEFYKLIKNSKMLNKVLVGPFYTHEKAKESLIILKGKIEKGSFLIKF